MPDEDHLAYGEYHGSEADQQQGGERGFLGDTFNKLKKNEGFSSIFNKVHGAVHGIGTDLSSRVAGHQPPKPQNEGQEVTAATADEHRFRSFAPAREGNDAKYYVDGCDYMVRERIFNPCGRALIET